MNQFDKFRLDEHLYEMEETKKSAPDEVKKIYQDLISQLNNVGITSSTKRANFLTFWLGIEVQNIFADVLSGGVRHGNYFQFICSTIEHLLKFSFEDTRESAWALGSVMKEIAEDSMRIQAQTQDHT